MSWLWRGFQSALFYYISCTPCAVRAQHRRTKQSNRREKRAQEGGSAVDRHGGLYTRTLPLQMNPHWAEERDEGPIPRRKGDKNQKASESATRLNTGGQGSSFGASSAETGTTLVGRSLDGEDTWANRHKRYQRPDETLWGTRRRDEEDASGSGLHSTSSAATDRSYMVGKNPAVNDMHPPIVSTQPTSKAQTMWMLQPPPPAKVMAGKMKHEDVHGNRIRSGTGTSKGSKESAKAKGSRTSSKSKADDANGHFTNFDQDSFHDIAEGPSIHVQADPFSPASYYFQQSNNPSSPADITRSSSSRSTAGEKSRKQSMHRPPLSTINSESSNMPKWLHPADAEKEQMEQFRFPAQGPPPIADVWRSEWDDIDHKDRDVRMRWSMDI